MAVRPTTMMSEVFSAYAWAWKNRLVLDLVGRGVFDEPLTDHDLLVLSRAFDFSDGLREHCVPAAWEALDSTLDSGVRELVSHPPRTEAELAAAIAGLGHAVARRAVDGALDRLQSRWL